MGQMTKPYYNITKCLTYLEQDHRNQTLFDFMMANVVFSLEQLGFGGIHDKLISHEEANETIFNQQQQSCPDDYALLHDLQYDMFEEITKEQQCSVPFSSLRILKSYGGGFKRLRDEKVTETVANTTSTNAITRELSTEGVFRVAGAKFIQSSSQIVDAPVILTHPFGLYFSGLSDEETTDVELAVFLLAAAEKVGQQQLERARRLLIQFHHLSCKKGNPVQRVVYYFSEALLERIDRQSGRAVDMIKSKNSGNQQSCIIEEALMAPSPTMLACHETMPFSQIFKFTAIQAIIETVANSKKVHVIDFAIRNGIQWTILMQALHEYSIELLTITAVGTTARHMIEDTGKRLMSFAQSMGLPFCFKIVMVSQMLDLKEDLFELGPEDQALVVYAPLVLRTMLGQPDQLEALMRVVRSLNPRIMLVHEVEANHNSPIFASRFIDALFFFGAYFDCLEACMERDDLNRMTTESFLSSGIRNIVAAEGEERSIRSVKIDVWRAFLSRFGMVETELSTSSLYQADLVLKRFACGSCYTLDMNGKCLIIGWKGTPIHSISAWKFL